MKKNIIVVTDRIRVPLNLIPSRVIKSRYEVTLYKEDACKKCDNLVDRSPTNDICVQCSAFGGFYRFYNSTEARTRKVWSIPQADEYSVKAYLKNNGIEHEWVDNRVVNKMDHKVKFTGRLYKEGDVDSEGNKRPDQVQAVNKWAKRKVGILQLPPRGGKTVIATYAICRIGVKTVIIASQKDWLRQFYETMTGKLPARLLRNKIVQVDGVAERSCVTNIPDLQEETGKQVIFMPETFAKLQHFIDKMGEVPDILLITYQSFRKEESRIAKVLNKHYSFAVVDEEHAIGATEYLRFASKLDMRWRLGLTSSPHRKDKRSRLSTLVFGPVTSIGNTTTLKPRISFFRSAAKAKTDYQTWTGAFSWMVYNDQRNKEIVQQVFRDLRVGHNVILIPVDYKKHMNHLIKMINHQASVNAEKRGENWPGQLARAFHSGVNRAEVLSWVDSHDDNPEIKSNLTTKSPRVLVAIRSMIKQGIDLRRPSALYVVMPMSANKEEGAPMFYQMSYRVATPYAGKPEPKVLIWLDNINIFKRCATGLFWNEIFPKSSLKLGNKECTYLLHSAEIDTLKVATAKTVKQDKGVWW